jgi:hypothetical protein
MEENMIISRSHLLIWLMSLTFGLGALGCRGGAQTFLQESGAAHKKVEQMNWDSKDKSAYDTNWTTYEDLEH